MMVRGMFSSLGLAAVSLFAVLLVADPAAAQPPRAFRYYGGYWGHDSAYWGPGWDYYGPYRGYYAYWAYPYWYSPYIYSGAYWDWPGTYNFYAPGFYNPSVYFYGTNYAPYNSYGVSFRHR